MRKPKVSDDSLLFSLLAAVVVLALVPLSRLGAAPVLPVVSDACCHEDGCSEGLDETTCINLGGCFVPGGTCADAAMIQVQEPTVSCSDSLDPSNTGMPTTLFGCATSDGFSFEDMTYSDTCGSFDRFWTVTECGVTNSVAQVINISVNEPPTITCPADVTVECDEDASSAATGVATAMDCLGIGVGVDNITIEESDQIVAGGCPQEVTILRTWTATDGCNSNSATNSASCVQTITVVDTTSPEITCPADATVECPGSTSPDNTGEATATDNCDDDVTITFSDATTDGCGNTATIERTWTATDDCGNGTTCVQVIMIVDDTPPQITCPGTISIECGDSTDPTDTGEATATDDCDSNGITITHSDSSSGSCPETLTRTWTATDACGNSVSCNQTIFIEDTTKPAITCPADTTIECTDSTDPMDTGEATATDLCDPDPTITYSDKDSDGGCHGERRIRRKWKAEDECANKRTCNQFITVVDTTPPELDCPDDVTVECGASTHPCDTGFATATDACGFGGPPAPPAAGIASVGSSTLTGNVEDVGGCAPHDPVCQRVPFDTSLDLAALANGARPAVTKDTLPGIPSRHAPEFLNDGYYGNASSWIPNSASSWLKIDLGRRVLINRLTFGRDRNAGIDDRDPGQFTIEVACQDDVYANGNDDDDAEEYTTVFSSSDFGYDGLVDGTETIQATFAPVWARYVKLTPTSQMAAIDEVEIFEFLDQGPPPNITWRDEFSAGRCNGEYHLTRTWLAADDCGNVATCEQTIWVVDTTPPEIWCPSDVSIDCSESSDPDDTGRADADDGCSRTTINHHDIFFLNEGCPQGQFIERTWTATDDCGNGTTCTQIIEISDESAPEVECPPDGSVGSTVFARPTRAGEPTVDDNCDEMPAVEHVDSTTPGRCPEDTAIERTWTITDGCGNSTTCTQRLHLEPCCLTRCDAGCGDATCQGEVCRIDPFCCENQWDVACVLLALEICEVCLPPGPCCEENGTPGCEDEPCEILVCEIDPFCCSDMWDSECSEHALGACETCQDPPPPSDAEPCDDCQDLRDDVCRALIDSGVDPLPDWCEEPGG